MREDSKDEKLYYVGLNSDWSKFSNRALQAVSAVTPAAAETLRRVLLIRSPLLCMGLLKK